MDRYAYANNSPVKYTDPTGHFGKHNDDKSDYWNKQNDKKVKQLGWKWEKEKAEKAIAALVQATGKELALDPSLGVSAAFSGGKPMFGMPFDPPPPGTCLGELFAARLGSSPFRNSNSYSDCAAHRFLPRGHDNGPIHGHCRKYAYRQREHHSPGFI